MPGGPPAAGAWGRVPGPCAADGEGSRATAPLPLSSGVLREGGAVTERDGRGPGSRVPGCSGSRPHGAARRQRPGRVAAPGAHGASRLSTRRAWATAIAAPRSPMAPSPAGHRLLRAWGWKREREEAGPLGPLGFVPSRSASHRRAGSLQERERGGSKPGYIGPRAPAGGGPIAAPQKGALGSQVVQTGTVDWPWCCCPTAPLLWEGQVPLVPSSCLELTPLLSGNLFPSK